MLVTCDIDGVVGDVVAALLREVNSFWGTAFTSEICSNYETVKNLPDHFQEQALKAYRDPRLLQKVRPYPDALWGLREIVANDSSVVRSKQRGS